MLNGKRKQLPDLPDAVIDPKSLITQSVIGNGSEVEAGAVIDKSVVLDGCRIGANSEILGSVLSEDVYVGQGARLDGCNWTRATYSTWRSAYERESTGGWFGLTKQILRWAPNYLVADRSFLQPTGIDPSD